MTHPLAWLSLLACAERLSGASDVLFPPEVLPVYRIDIEEGGEETLRERFDPLTCDERVWTRGTLTYENPVTGEEEVYENVGVRYRGHNVFAEGGTERHGYKLSFDAFVEDRDFHGLDKVNLLGTEGDATLLHERLATELMREAGVPAARVTHARVYLDGDYMGVFPNSEETDDRAYLRAHFDGDDEGSLYKVKGYCGDRADLSFLGEEPEAYVGTYEPKAGTEEEDIRTDLLPMLRCASEPDDSAFAGCIDAHIDREEWLTEIVLDTILPDVDSMAGAGQNFLLYRPTDGRFVVYPWDKDQAFRPDLAHGGVASIFELSPAWLAGSTPMLVQRLRTVFRAETCARAGELLEIYDPAVLEPRIDSLEELMASAIAKDPFLDDRAWRDGLDALRDVVRTRHEQTLAEVAACGG
jgi:hypothetical protein